MTDDDFHADPEIDGVLTQRLSDLGSSSFLGSAGHGADWSAKRLKTETDSVLLDFPPGEQNRLLAQAADALSALGPSKQDVTDDSVVTVRGLIGSGFASMNPAYVIFVVDPSSSTVGVAAYAKEGLIKQRTAHKAVAKVREALGL